MRLGIIRNLADRAILADEQIEREFVLVRVRRGPFDLQFLGILQSILIMTWKQKSTRVIKKSRKIH